MNRETLVARKAEMEAQRARGMQEMGELDRRRAFLVAEGHTLYGAIQDCEHWLAQMPDAEPDPEPEPEAATLELLKNRRAKREAASLRGVLEFEEGRHK